MSDPIDALACARAALAEDLPAAGAGHRGRNVKMLLDHREDLVGEMVRMRSPLRWYPHDIDPDFAATIPTHELHRPEWIQRVREFLASQTGSVATAISVDLIGRIHELAQHAAQLEREIAALVHTPNSASNPALKSSCRPRAYGPPCDREFGDRTVHHA